MMLRYIGTLNVYIHQGRTQGGVLGVQTPPEIFSFVIKI